MAGVGSSRGEEKTQFVCTEAGCGKSYSRLEYLRRHERKHQDSKPFPCSECSKSFARSDVLLRHKRRCHPDVDFDATPAAGVASNRNASRRDPPLHDGSPSSSSSHDRHSISPVATDGGSARPLHAVYGASERSRPPPASSSTRDSRREQAAPYPHPHRLTSQTTNFTPTSRSSGIRGDGGGQDHEMAGQHPELQTPSGSASTPSSNAGSLYTADTTSSRSSGIAIPPVDDGYYPLPMIPSDGSVPLPPHLNAADPLALLALAYPNFVAQQQQHHHQQGVSHSQQPNAFNAPVNDGAQPQPAPVQPSLVPSPRTTSAFLGGNDWNFFSPPIVTPCGPGGGGASSNDALRGVAASTSPNGGPGGFPFPKSWSPGPGGMFDGLSPHPEAEFLFDGMGLFPPSAASPPAPLSPNTARHQLQQTQAYIESMEAERDRANAAEQAQDGGDPDKDKLEPERKMLLQEGNDRLDRIDLASYDLDSSDKFFISIDRFRGCYAVDHWRIPSIGTLSKIARRTITQLVPHIPMVHPATFNLSVVPGCLAFSICTVGGPRRRGHGPKHPDGNSERKYSTVSARQQWDQESASADSWDGLKSVVKREKTDMLIKSFTRSQGVLFTEYNVGLLQALILYNAPAFLSDSHEQRWSAHMQLGTIINIARQIGVFDDTNGHVAPERGQAYTLQEQSLEHSWHKWIRWEGIRRTAFLLFVLDTVASLETGTPRQIAPAELAAFPLPASDPLWEARDAEEWQTILSTSRGYTLKRMMNILETPANQKESDCLSSGHRKSVGPFAWLVCGLVLVRQVLDLGEGKRKEEAAPWCTTYTDEEMPTRVQAGLERWRRGWDFDTLCRRVDSAGPDESDLDDCACITPLNASVDTPSTSSRSESSPGLNGLPKGDGGKRLPYADTIFCREALPYWWFAKILLNILMTDAESFQAAATAGQSPPVFQRGVDQFQRKGIVFREILESARTFSRSGEGMFFS